MKRSKNTRSNLLHNLRLIVSNYVNLKFYIQTRIKSYNNLNLIHENRKKNPVLQTNDEINQFVATIRDEIDPSQRFAKVVRIGVKYVDASAGDNRGSL